MQKNPQYWASLLFREFKKSIPCICISLSHYQIITLANYPIMLSPELNRLLLYLGIGLVSFSTIIGLFAKKIRNSFKPFSKKAIWYLLISVAVFALTGL